MSIATKIATINSKMDEALAMQEAGDYSGALKKAEGAYLLIVGLPDRVRLENEELQWSPSGLKEAIAHLQRRAATAQTSGNGCRDLMQSTKIRYSGDD